MCFQRAVVGQATGDLTTVRRHAHHHFAATEAALNQLDPDRQQTLVALGQCRHRTRVQHQRAPGLQMTSQPLLARRQHAALRRKQGADALASLQAIQDTIKTPTDDDGMRTGTGSQSRSAQFGLHTATSQRTARTARHRVERRIIGARFVN
ncbi:hypothetical protein D3C86_1609830 [compost metagenome]